MLLLLVLDNQPKFLVVTQVVKEATLLHWVLLPKVVVAVEVVVLLEVMVVRVVVVVVIIQQLELQLQIKEVTVVLVLHLPLDNLTVVGVVVVLVRQALLLLHPLLLQVGQVAMDLLT
jgi:hypothetical protein